MMKDWGNIKWSEICMRSESLEIFLLSNLIRDSSNDICSAWKAAILGSFQLYRCMHAFWNNSQDEMWMLLVHFFLSWISRNIVHSIQSFNFIWSKASARHLHQRPFIIRSASLQQPLKLLLKIFVEYTWHHGTTEEAQRKTFCLTWDLSFWFFLRFTKKAKRWTDKKFGKIKFSKINWIKFVSLSISIKI